MLLLLNCIKQALCSAYLIMIKEYILIPLDLVREEIYFIDIIVYFFDLYFMDVNVVIV